MTWKRKVITAAGVLALVGVVVVAARPKPLPVEVATLAAGPLEATLDEEGRTRVRDRYVISATVPGNLRRAELHPGDAVEAGAVVARIVPLDPTPLDARARTELEGRVRLAEAALRQSRSTVDRARDASDFAQRELQRITRLVSTGAVAPHDQTLAEFTARSRRDELASAEFGARATEYELGNARALLARATSAAPSRDEIELRSPVRGRVLRVLQASGGVVAAGTALLEVGDTTALEIVVDLLTADAAQVATGATVHLENWGGAETLTGHVRLIEPSAFTRVSALGVEEQRVNALVDIHDPHARWQTLGDGWRVEARIVVWEGARVLTAPLGAVFRRAGVWNVFVVEAGKARRRNVTLGHRGGDRVEVTAGLRVGDRVVVHPPDRLAEGDAVVAE